MAIDAIQARGEPATEDRMIGELLVDLDRAGHLRRFIREHPAIWNEDIGV